MKQLRCIIFSALAATSALLFVLVVAAWIRSYCCTDAFTQESTWLYPENAAYNAHLDEGVLLPTDETVITVVICSSRGVLRITRERGGDTDPNPPNKAVWRHNPSATATDLVEVNAATQARKLGSANAPCFGAESNLTLSWPKLKDNWYQGRIWAAVEYRLLAALFALLPLTWLLSYRSRRNKRLRDYCRCGYNLTGNVSGICPECGSGVARR